MAGLWVAVFAAVFVWSAIEPKDYPTWAAHKRRVGKHKEYIEVQLEDVSHQRGRTGRSWLALLLFLGFVVGGIVTGEFAFCALAAAALMVVTACITAEEAYGFADWRLLVLIGGMLSVAAALRLSAAISRSMLTVCRISRSQS